MTDATGKSPAAGRMGKATEYLVSAFCILITRGELNVSTSLVDDEGVDLVFHKRGGTATLAVQVKARMLSAATIKKGTFLADVRSQTFAARDDLAMLFVAVNDRLGALDSVWLVPSVEFNALKGNLNSQQNYRFSAAMNLGSQDKWSQFRLDPLDLPEEILNYLGELELTGK
jgi:hypothetical protein